MFGFSGSSSKSREEAAERERRYADYESRIDALDRFFAVIEFDPAGNILSVNDNFLAGMGYSRDEVVGKHHSMFVADAYRNSSEYAAFWEKLRRGEHFAGEYLRYGKGRKEVWIDATYSPVLNPDGTVQKVVKYAKVVSGQKRQMADYEGQLEAVRRSLGFIEFMPDGTVVDANDNFLRLMGYSLNEIRGKHHRMFVDPQEAGSPEYAAFWESLRRGECQARDFRRITSSGDEVWMQASYNPIADENGRLVKIVKYATDITEQVQQRRALETAFEELSRVMTAMAEGDLTARVEGRFDGDFAKLQETVNRGMEKLHDLITELMRTASSVETGAQEIAKGNSDLSGRSEEAASNLEETASSMEEMTATVRQNAENADKANHLVQKASEQAEVGGSVVRNAVTAMEAVNASSRQISDIIGVIDEIAFQTNLLALNASVEAARAGEQGRGFAVVASEVRNLAGRSATAAKEIKDLIVDSSKKVEEGSELVNKSGETLADIVEAVRSVTDIVGEIAAASREQAAGIDEVNNSVSQMDELTQQNAALVEEIAAASESLTSQAEGLQRMISFFTIDQQAGVVSPQKSSWTGEERRSAERPWTAPASAEAANMPKASAAASSGTDDLDWQEF